MMATSSWIVPQISHRKANTSNFEDAKTTCSTSRHSHPKPHTCACTLARRVQGDFLRSRARAPARFSLHVVSRSADAWHFFHPAHHRPASDAVLPSLDSARLRRHERPALRRVVRSLLAKSAPLVGARDGVPGVRTHGQSVLPRRLPAAAGIELGRRCVPSAADASRQLHGLLIALGSTIVLGHDGGIEHHLIHPIYW